MITYARYKTYQTKECMDEYIAEIDKIFETPMKVSSEARDILRSNHGIDKMISFVQEHVLPVHDIDVIAYEAAEALEYLNTIKTPNRLYVETKNKLSQLSTAISTVLTENKNALSVFCAYIENDRIPKYLRNYYLLESGKGKPADFYALYEYGAIPDLARLSISGVRKDINMTKDLGTLDQYTESDIEWIIAMNKVFSDKAFTEAVLKIDPTVRKKIKQFTEAFDMQKRFAKIITEGAENVERDFEILDRYHGTINRYTLGHYNALSFGVFQEEENIPGMFERLEKFEKASYKATGKIPTYMTKHLYMGKGEDEDSDAVDKVLDDDKEKPAEKKKADDDWMINKEGDNKYDMDKYDDYPVPKKAKTQTTEYDDPVAPMKLPDSGTYNITYNYNNSYNKHTDNSKRNSVKTNTVNRNIAGNTFGGQLKSSGNKDFDEAFATLVELDDDIRAFVEATSEETPEKKPSNVENEDPNKGRSPTEIVKNAALDVDRAASKGLGHVQKGVSDIDQAGKAITRTPKQVVALVSNFIKDAKENKSQRIKEDMMTGSHRYKILDLMRTLVTSTIPFAIFNPLMATLFTMFVTIPAGGINALRHEVKGGKYWKIKTELQNEILTEIRITQDKIKDADRDDPHEKQRLMRTLDALRNKYVQVFGKDPKLQLKKDMDW